MRVLFATRPFFGHFYPTVPLARRVAADGHEVLVATAEPFRASVEATGFRFAAAGADPWMPIEDGEFGPTAATIKATDMLRLAAEWPPDVIVRDPTDFGALVAGEALDVPMATIGFCHHVTAAWWVTVVGDALDEARRRLGLQGAPAADLLEPRLYLDFVPPWFQQPPGPPADRMRLVRPELYSGPHDGVDDGWLRGLDDRPTVYVTLGTVYNRNPGFFHAVVDALADEPVNVVCTTGPGWDGQGVVSANVRTIPWFPADLLLPHCRAIVCHAGYSTVMGALLFGVPVLGVPFGSDQHWNAARCEQLGAGLTLDPDQMEPDAIRDRVRGLVEDPGYRDRAGELRATVERLPPIEDAVQALTVLAGRVPD